MITRSTVKLTWSNGITTHAMINLPAAEALDYYRGFQTTEEDDDGTERVYEVKHAEIVHTEHFP